jgi:error-prone DNA polymerase
VENSREQGFSFLVEHIGDLHEALAGARVPTPKAVSASGAFLRARRRGRRRAS